MAQKDYLVKQIQRETESQTEIPVWVAGSVELISWELLNEDPDLVYIHQAPGAFTFNRIQRIYIAASLWDVLKDLSGVDLVEIFCGVLAKSEGLITTDLYTKYGINRNPGIVFSDRLTALRDDIGAILDVVSSTNKNGVSSSDVVGLVVRLDEVEKKFRELDSEFDKCRVGLDLVKVTLSQEVLDAT